MKNFSCIHLQTKSEPKSQFFLPWKDNAFLWRPKELKHQKIRKIINDFWIITGHRFCIWMKWTGNGIWSICGSHNDNFLQCLAYTDGLATETKNHYSILYINGGTESRHVDVYISPLRIKGHTQYWWCEMA